MAEMKTPQTHENAEILALEGLGWLAGQEDGFQRFLDQSGIDATDLRAAAGRPETGLAVLDFLLAQPASVQFIVSTRGFEPGSVFTSVMAVIVCGISVSHLGEPPAIAQLELPLDDARAIRRKKDLAAMARAGFSLDLARRALSGKAED